MAYDTANPPILVSYAPITGSGKRWRYVSADAKATVDAAGYITNGGALGMKVDDIVEVDDTTNNITSSHRVISVSATYPGVVDLGDGTDIAVATNTD
jgi:hypothetical protein